jgi:hypothetical protein
MGYDIQFKADIRNHKRNLVGQRHVVVSRKALAAGIAASTGGLRFAAHESRIHSKFRHMEGKLALSS